MRSFRVCEVSLELFAEADNYILKAILADAESKAYDNQYITDLGLKWGEEF